MISPGAALTWLGRQTGPVFLAAVFAGVLVPPLASLLQPLLLPAILLPFIVALVRLDLAALRRQARRPALALSLVLWSLVGCPLLTALVLRLLPLDPAIAALMVTTAACAPLMASGALALLLELDVALALLVVVPATALVPFTVPPLALGLAGIAIDLPATALALRLATMVLGSAALAWLVRHWLGPERLMAARPALDGLAVLGLALFAVGVMDGFTMTALARPSLVGGIVLVVFALNLGLQAITILALLPILPLRMALTAGLVAGNNNLGLILAAVIDTAPPIMLIFVATAQFPIYLLPIVQRPLYRHWLNEEPLA